MKRFEFLPIKVFLGEQVLRFQTILNFHFDLFHIDAWFFFLFWNFTL